MANIKRIDGKTGVSFKITVTQGRDSSGKQIRHFMTWTPTPKMTDRQIEKEVVRAAYDFERQIELGYVADDRQKFEQYAEYVLDLKSRAGCKYRTIERYRELLERINPEIGHLKIVDIRPQHLNNLYKNLEYSGKRKGNAIAKQDLYPLMKQKQLSRAEVARSGGIGASSVTAACKGKKISLPTADAVAGVLGEKTSNLFICEISSSRLSNKTVLEHHRLIRTILAQADKEMLVPYNAAAKATPPKALKKEVNYFQVGDVERIRDALDTEPLKWKTITHLLLITGCRRGEIMGLKWEKVYFKKSQIKIDTALLYSANKGVYESSTKTDNIRFIKLPIETMQLLAQYRKETLELQLKNGSNWHNSGYVFVRNNGERMHPDTITGWLSRFSKRNNLPHINPHAFRHTMASILIRNGQDIVSVSKRLGHAKVSTTTDFYSHIIAEADEEASECLADVMLRNRSIV